MTNAHLDGNASAFRRRFIEFIRELYGFLGHAAPELDKVGHNEELAVELQVDEMLFFVVHSPEHPARLTACVRVGALPEANALVICRQLLALNVQLAWNSHATLGLDDDGQILYMFKTQTDESDPRSFLNSLQQVAHEVEAWTGEHLLAGPDAGAAACTLAAGLSPV